MVCRFASFDLTRRLVGDRWYRFVRVKDERILALTRELVSQGKPTAAICAAPMVLAEASGGGVALIETTMANPYVRPRGTTGISMGCCATMIYEVLETGEEGARLRLRSSKDPQKETRWYWSAEACRDKR